MANIEAESMNREGKENPQKFDALIVLGKNIGVKWSPKRIRETPDYLSPHSKLNVLATGDMYMAGVIGKIFFSAGHTAGKAYPSEAQAMKDYLLKKFPDIPENAITLEEESLDTWSNAKEVKIIIDKYNFQNIGLLTVGFHQKRANFLFEQEGFSFTPFSMEDVINKRKPLFGEAYAKTKLVREEEKKEKAVLSVQKLPLGKLFVSVVTRIKRNPNR